MVVATAFLKARLRYRKLLSSNVPLKDVPRGGCPHHDVWGKRIEYGLSNLILRDQGGLRALPQTRREQVDHPIGLVDLVLSALAVGTHQQIAHLHHI